MPAINSIRKSEIFAVEAQRPSYTRQFFLQLATQRWRMKNLASCRGGVARLQLFSQLATRSIRNKMADAQSRRHLELWLAHSDKIALQVAEGMLHATFVALQVARKIASCNMALSSLKYAKLGHFMLLGSFSKPRRRRRRERHQIKGLMSRTIALHVCLESWYISLPSSTKEREAQGLTFLSSFRTERFRCMFSPSNVLDR